MFKSFQTTESLSTPHSLPRCLLQFLSLFFTYEVLGEHPEACQGPWPRHELQATPVARLSVPGWGRSSSWIWIAHRVPVLTHTFLFFTPQQAIHPGTCCIFDEFNQKYLTGIFIIIFSSGILHNKNSPVRHGSIVKLSVSPAPQACGTVFHFSHWESSLVVKV